MKIVLAYSGGLDTSVLLSWIKEKYHAELIAFCANIGQEEELQGLEKKARNTGASKIYIDDLQDEFAREFIFPMIQAGAIYEGQYFLGTSIAPPLMARPAKATTRCASSSLPPRSRRICRSSRRGGTSGIATNFPVGRR